VRIESVELDDRNTPHVAKHGVGPNEVVQVFASHPPIRRNKKDSTGAYYAIAFGIRVNFIYNPVACTARPISAWRI